MILFSDLRLGQQVIVNYSPVRAVVVGTLVEPRRNEDPETVMSNVSQLVGTVATIRGDTIGVRATVATSNERVVDLRRPALIQVVPEPGLVFRDAGLRKETDERGGKYVLVAILCVALALGMAKFGRAFEK